MPISNQVKSLTEDIEASYGARRAAVSDIVKETHQTLGHFNREHEKMTRDLRSSLASNRSARASHVQNMRAENEQDLKEMARELAESLSASEKERRAAEEERRKEFATLIGEIQGLVADIEKDTAQTLADCRSDHQEMANALKTSLSRETKERIDTIHELLSHFTEEHQEMATSLRSELSSFQRNLRQAVDEMMADFSSDHRQAHTHWEHLTRVMAAKRAGKHAPSAKAEMGVPTAVKEEDLTSAKPTGVDLRETESQKAIVTPEPFSRAQNAAPDKLAGIKQPPTNTLQVAIAEKTGIAPTQPATKSNELNQEPEPKKYTQPQQDINTQPAQLTTKTEQTSQKSGSKEHKQTKPFTEANKPVQSEQ
jgi:translation initiation factor 1 (eIF-1/SUI1)